MVALLEDGTKPQIVTEADIARACVEELRHTASRLVVYACGAQPQVLLSITAVIDGEDVSAEAALNKPVFVFDVGNPDVREVVASGLINVDRIDKAIPGRSADGNSSFLEAHEGKPHVFDLSDELATVRDLHLPPEIKEDLPKGFSIEEFALQYGVNFKPQLNRGWTWEEWPRREEVIREVGARSRAAWLAASTLSRVRASWEDPATVDIEAIASKRDAIKRQLDPLKKQDAYTYELLKHAVEHQECTETEHLTFSWQTQPTKHVSLGDLARLIVERNITADVRIKLTKEIENALGDMEDANGQPLLNIEHGHARPKLNYRPKS